MIRVKAGIIQKTRKLKKNQLFFQESAPSFNPHPLMTPPLSDLLFNRKRMSPRKGIRSGIFGQPGGVNGPAYLGQATLSIYHPHQTYFTPS